MRRRLLVLMTCAAVASAHSAPAGYWLPSATAAPLAPAVRTEIDALLARLSSSACQVNRNGTWHDAAEARTHMLRKLEYLDKKAMVQTTEQFIELAASTSSASGKPYLIRCGQGTPVASRAWLLMQLQTLRGAGAASVAR